MKVKVEIKYPRFAVQFGRQIAFGQIYKDGALFFDGSIAQILEVVKVQDFEIENAQEILDLIVRLHGFAC